MCHIFSAAFDVLSKEPLPSMNTTVTPKTSQNTDRLVDAHLSAAVAMSNPLVSPQLRLDGLEASQIAQRAHHLGTAAAVTRHLSRGGHGEALSEFDRAVYPTTLARNMLSLSMADEVSTELTRLGMRVAPLKGYAFLLDLYNKDIGVRRMFDVDMIIDRPTFVDAVPVLERLGWTRELRPPVTTRLNVESVWRRDLGQMSVKLELHRRLCLPGRYRIDHRQLWANASTFGADAPSWRLDPAHVLLYLAIHKAQHGFLNDCRDMIDATNLCRTHRIEWLTVVDTAHRWACTAAAWLFLKRCRRAFSMPVPDEALTLLRPPHWRARALDAMLPDATLNTDFYQRRNNRRRLSQKVALSVLASDTPGRETLALGAVAVRSLGDRLCASLQPESLEWLDHVPLGARVAP